MPILPSHDVHGPAGAPVVVLGSSLGTDRTMWDEQLPALSARYRVVRYDHRGHGSSSVPAGPYAIPDLGRDVVRLLDHLGVRRAHLVGLSLGGMVAMWMAVHHPARVDRTVLVCTAAAIPPPAVWRDRAARVRTEGTSAVADDVVARWFTPAFAGTSRAHALRQVLIHTDDEGYASSCDAIRAMDLHRDLAGIGSPTLVVAGEQDRATPPALGHDLRSAIRAGGGTCDIAVVPGAAHLANVERPQAVTDLILGHLDDKDGSP